MSGSFNQITLVGNLARDPEQKTMNDGKPVVNLTVVTSESWKSKETGERKEKAQFHKVVIFNENLCRIASEYLKKGSKLLIQGALQHRSYTQDGAEKWISEIVLQQYQGTLTMLGNGGSENSGGDNDSNIPF